MICNIFHNIINPGVTRRKGMETILTQEQEVTTIGGKFQLIYDC